MIHQDRELHEECGVFGVVGHQDAAQICYYGLHSLQHRGQEAAGICCECNSKMNIYKGEGLVTEVFDQDKLKNLNGNVAIGHVRYSTAGGGLANVQPFVFRTMEGSMSICHNGNLVNANILKQELEDQGSIFSSTSDTEVLGHLIKRQEGHMIDRICASLDKLDGAFAFLVMLEGRIYAARDKYGLRPLSIGILSNGAYVFASETCALDVIGAKFVRDVEPGEIVRVKDGKLLSKTYTKDSLQDKICAMEYIYFSRPDSNLDGINVHTTRKLAGKQLYYENPIEADVVIGVPDSSISAAIGYAEASGIPYEMGLVKNKYVGRTFIQPTQEMREQGVRMKLSAVSSIVSGKKVVMIDDSIVRGTTSKRIVRHLKDAGAKEVHVRIASPAIKFPCFYGVDTSTLEELISNKMSVDELREYIEADSLAFISEEGLHKSIHFDHQKCGLCMSCFNGNYVTNLYDSFDKANKFEK